MSKHNYKKSRLKYVFLAFTCAAAFAFSGIASACGNDDSSEKEKDKTTTKEDTQLLKNGNFEIFTIPEKKEGGNEPEYLIKTPENWSHGGTTSYTMSGIISTSETAWDKIKAETLADDLDYNNKLDSSSSSYLSEYIDYNGMKSSDILYKNQYNALRKDEDIKEEEQEKDEIKNRKDIIENPGTHYDVRERDGKLSAVVDDEIVDVFENEETGEYFLDKEFKQPISNVLMLHNYATSHYGIAQYYSSVEIELPANTAAEISLWVKTSYLKHSEGKTVKQDKGANISVTQTVGSTTLDKFTISSINTEKLLGKEGFENEKSIAEDKYNGWVEYTIYVNACDFASSKIKLELGLGESGYTTEGYAFFDDVKVTKFSSLDDEACSYTEAYNNGLLKDTTCNLSSDASEKIFKADRLLRNEGIENEEKADVRNSDDFHYLIDLASENMGSNDDNNSYYTPVSFLNSSDLKTGYTVDSDNYVSSINPITDVNSIGFKSDNLNAVSDKWRLPTNFTSITTSSDLLACVKTDNNFTGAYSEKLNKALEGATTLPKNDKNNESNMLVMLSARGAAYTTSFNLDIKAEGYKIISFWVKTSDMGGSTAATLKIKTDDDNSSQFTVDTTDKVTDLENEKDIFNGWVQCFFFVHNELEEAKTFTVEFSFGNTTIKGTEARAYKYGWVALANMQTLDVEEKIFAYTGNGDNTASLTISEEAEKKTHVFDEAYGNQSHEIKSDMVKPSSYDGVNGASSSVTHNDSVSTEFDKKFGNDTDNNGKKFAGLINKEYFTDGSEYTKTNWYKTLLGNFIDADKISTIEATNAWNDIFGNKSVQPLIITNVMRDIYVEEKGATKENFDNGTYFIKNNDGNFETASGTFDEKTTYYSLKQVMNYGYIGKNKTVSDSYETISVRVKVSANATAYVYLVDTSAGKQVLSFNAPSYSFYYDVDGNVLKAEPKDNATVSEQRKNVLYSLRDDGLYEDKDGNLYANTWNYKKLYYTIDSLGKKIYIENLEDGEKYLDENGNEGNHYLVTGDGIKVYEFIDGDYHYIVEGKTQSAIVNPFDINYARYDDLNDISEKYMVKISGEEHPNEWVTVTFVVHAGSKAKSYRLELWSGERDQLISDKNAENGAVIFDYSYTTVSDDSLKSEYEKEIIDSYLEKLANVPGALDKIDTTNKNIKYYEKLAKDNNVEIDDIEYKAHYYTYSLYDSADFQPFNKDVASDNATGYDYDVSAQTESLVYLSVKEKNANAYTIFADYSAIDKSVSLNNPSDDDTDDTTDEDSGSDGSIWLLASSIILVIALVFAIIAIFLKDVIKKARRNKVTKKNNYDHRKTNRYKRKLHLKQEEIVEVDRNEGEETETEEVENNDEVEEETSEVVEETPVEEVEENVSDNETEAPVEEENPDNGEQE